MTNIKSKTIAAMVTENIRTAHIFKKHGIDFCCGGDISNETVCSDLLSVREELEQTERSSS